MRCGHVAPAAVPIAVMVMPRHDHMAMPVVNGVAPGFPCLSGRHVAVSPSGLPAMVPSARTGRLVMAQNDPVIAVMTVVMAYVTIIAVMVSIPIAIMMSGIITTLSLMTPGK